MKNRLLINHFLGTINPNLKTSLSLVYWCRPTETGRRNTFIFNYSILLFIVLIFLSTAGVLYRGELDFPVREQSRLVHRSWGRRWTLGGGAVWVPYRPLLIHHFLVGRLINK